MVALGVDVVASGDVLGAAFVLLGDNSPTQILAPGGDINIPETENHRLMIETSRYLTNAAIITKLGAEGYDHIDALQSEQTDIRNWLLQRLQSITQNDFHEYNARPYTRYSLNAIVNLYDFAPDITFYNQPITPVLGDTDLQTAAQIVLDLSEAKFAATSNRGRRIVPFRRLSESDYDDSAVGQTGLAPDRTKTTDLYDIVAGADHEVARAMMLAGQTEFLPNGGLPSPALNDLVNAAISNYALPDAVIAAAFDRSVSSQTIRHAGVERVFQSPAFTISAGGVKTPPPLAAYFGKIDTEYDNDAGVATPTAIIPTLTGNFIADVFRFDGVGTRDKRSDNLCVAQNFACGISPMGPGAFGSCADSALPPSMPTFYISSAKCFPGPGPHFYMAGRVAPCDGSFCDAGLQWGVVEIVEASPPPPGADDAPAADPAYEQFKASREPVLEALAPDSNGNATYVTSDNRQIAFTLTEQKPEVTTINGAPVPAWATEGDVLVSDGAGRATITSKAGRIRIDFTDWQHPKRMSP